MCRLGLLFVSRRLGLRGPYEYVLAYSPVYSVVFWSSAGIGSVIDFVSEVIPWSVL